jgi:protein SCO1/2
MRFLVLWGLLFSFLGCSGGGNNPGTAFIGADVSGVTLGSDKVLTDHHGSRRRLSDFKGKVVALFFGYTHCPDVCPTTMSDLAKALKILGSRSDDVQVLFITLDPERDSTDVLSKYVPYFNPDFLGLRTDEEATKKLAQDFKIFFARQESSSKSGYTIDHSAGVYVFDRKGYLRIYLNHGQTSKDIAHDFGLLLNE